MKTRKLSKETGIVDRERQDTLEQDGQGGPF